jgi:predicted O-linked N-acetylglucosamine transferase (SPINDLY family)
LGNGGSAIAFSELEYIEIAGSGVDKADREEIREKIKANHHNLSEDLECVKGLEKFYQDVVKSNME